MPKEYYLAYGSNIHPYRLQRITPSARALAVVHLPNQLVTFHKRSKDGSGKCNLFEKEASEAYGVLYEIDSVEMSELHRHEGTGYIQQQMLISLAGEVYAAIVYIATSESISEKLSPYHWYKDLVVAGAEYFGFPQSYVVNIQSSASLPDPDPERQQSNKTLLSGMKQHEALMTPIPRV